MISYNNLDQYLEEFKFFEKIRTDKKIFTFTVTSHWHNYMLLVSNVLASRGICIDYYWKDYFAHYGKNSKDEIIFLKTYFNNLKNKKKNANLKFFNIENLQSSKVPSKLKEIIENQSR